MKRQGVTVLALAALVVCPLVQAHAQTQTEMNITADKQFKHADARLHVVYARVRSLLDASGRAKLEKAEQAWVTYRDAEAGLEAHLYHGGSMEPMVYANVQKNLTDARIKELQGLEAELKSS
jgi:uncharacterized protein YecT (DUF1311 family)